MGVVFENRLLAGRYQLVSKLGHGGMGSVWRAQDRHLRIQVAIKLLDPNIVDDEDARARFQREALSAAQLRSTHIVHITDHGIDGDTPFIAMELLEGESLAARLHRLGKLSLADTVQILSQVARALTVAHAKGIAHRDLKPDNVFIVREGDLELVKVLDFGVAKRLDAPSVGGSVKTRTGALLGTPCYMSPEQAHGKSLVDHRTDVWSFGVMGYECITGRRPFDEPTLAALLLSICSEPPPTPSSVSLVPSGFDEWFSRATSRDLDRRFSSAAEAAQALAALVPNTSQEPTTSPYARAHTVSAITTPTAETVKPSSVTSSRAPTGVMKARPPALLLLGLPAVAALGGLAWWLHSRPNSPPPPAASRTVALTAEHAPSNERPMRPPVVAVPSVAAPSVPPVPTNAPSPESPAERAAAPTPSVSPVSATTPGAAPATSRSVTAASVVTKPAVPTPGVTRTEKKPSIAATGPGPARTPTTRTPSTPLKLKPRDYAGF